MQREVILRNEFNKSLKAMKTSKAPDIDDKQWNLLKMRVQKRRMSYLTQ